MMKTKYSTPIKPPVSSQPIQSPPPSQTVLPVASPAAPLPPPVSYSIPPTAHSPSALPPDLPSRVSSWSIVGRSGNDVTVHRSGKILIVSDGSRLDGCVVKVPSIECKE
jgi:hypothetical protein